MKTYLTVLLCALSSVASATKYFVSSSTGSDASDGKSSGTAWKTIAKINASTFSPGDTIAFKKGDVWRETLTVPSSGTSASYISFSSTFGTGANPQILGSTKAITWTETATGSHIWKSATVISANPYSSNSAEIFYENSDGTKSWGTYQTGTGSLTAEYNWTWVSSNIYVYSASDPTTRYNSVEIPQRESTVNMNKKNYIHFDGIDMFYSIHSGYGYDYTHNDMFEQFGLIIENSDVGYIGAWDASLETGYGIEVVYTDMIVRKNKLHDCGRRSFAMDVYGNGYTAQNILVEDNEFFNGFHTTGLDIDVGAGYNGNLNNITIRRNYLHESLSRSTDLSNMIFIQNNAVGTCTINNVYIYDNIFRWQNGYGILMEGIQSAYIYNNVFSEKATACPNWVAFVAAQVNSHVTANNNIFYGGTSGSIDALDLSSTYFTHDYNLFFGTASETETHGQISKNPMFVDPANNNFHLLTGSPAIGTGIAVAQVTNDYEGNAFSNPPNMGIYTSQVASSNPVYVSSAVENATPSILSITYNPVLANIVPASSAFSVLVNSVSRTIGSVAIVSGKVQLTLSTPVIFGDIVTVSYTIPATNPLQTSAGLQAASITAKPVTNNCSAPAAIYASSSIENATPTILTMTYNPVLANIVPASSAFNIMVNSVTRGISSVAVVSGKVQLTLSSPVVFGDVVTVAYTKPATNPLQTTAGGQAASITAQAVVNNLLAVSPVYVSSAIENATPSILSMTYNPVLANIVPASSAFNVMVNSVTRGISSVAVVSGKVQLTLSTPVIFGDIVTVSYTVPAANPLQTSAGTQAASITAQTVTNNCSAPVTVYTSSSIENATPSILSMTYNPVLANIVPASSAFNVMVNSVTRGISSVAIVSGTVQLTLSSPVVFGDVVTVAYTKPATNPLQTTAGGQAASITAQTVTNNLLAVNPVYVSSAIENATPSILSMTYNPVLANIVPASSAFNVIVNSVARGIGSVAIVSGKVQLTLSSPVVLGDVITVSYTKPATNPLQTAAGGQALGITAQAVTNNLLAVNPVYVSSAIENATPSILSMTYNQSLANIVPASSAFSVMVNSITRGISSVSVSGVNVQLTLASPVVLGDVVTVTYTKPATNPLQTTAGGQAASITAQAVTNNLLAVNPVYVSSVIENATPSILSMTYNQSLANIVPASSAFSVMVNSITRGISSVSVSGVNVQLTLASPVVLGDVVTVTYTKPATNPLQTTAGGQAASITAQAVTNNLLAVNPVYVSSVIENVTPSILSMTYNQSLANIVPASSAFNVMVNSVTRGISSVAIVSGKVQLTLSSPVVLGDVITVTYTKPATNPLQTTAGGQAASITAQAVTNNLLAVNPVYVSSAIENVTPSILSMTYNQSLANIVPASSAFSVMVNSITRGISSVSVSGVNVQLTLASPVVLGDVVTVTYTKPATNPLQTTAGGQAASITAQAVTNNLLAVNPVYVSSVIENVTPSILSMTYNQSLANIVPASSAFNVMVNSVTRGISSVAIVSGKVQLTLSSPVVLGDVITVTYTKPATNPLQTTAGGQAASITAQAVTNNLLAVNPVYVSSAIENVTPSILSMTYNQSLANIVPASSAFNVMVNSVTRGISSVAIVSGKVQLTLSSPVVLGDVITVSYTKPATNPLQTTAGGQAASITAQAVTNNLLAVNPVYVSSAIENATPSILSMTYNQSLANIVPASSAFNVMVNSVTRGISSVAIVSGKVQLTLSSPVVLGDVITVSYTKPATNPLQTTAGGQAASITAQAVTNNLLAVNPVYVSSAIENASPSLLSMTYNLSIANIVPASSAFRVLVNSVSRGIGTLTISGGKVQLQLASPVVFGDLVTVSYTKPAINPLQTTSGGQAVSIGTQPVTNNISNSNNNTPPVIVLTYNKSIYSGFVGVLDASTSYDANSDPLTFEWIVPANVEVSSKTGSKLQFLAPIVRATQTINFTLKVSDGKSVQSKLISISVIPYRSRYYKGRITRITSNGSKSSNDPYNTIDEDLKTSWATSEPDQYLIFELEKPVKVAFIELAFLEGQTFSSHFDIWGSKDNITWEPLLLDAASSDFADGFQVFEIPETGTKTAYSFIKLIDRGNSKGEASYVSEFQVFGMPDVNSVEMNVYPNPASDNVNISIINPILSTESNTPLPVRIIKILDIKGAVVMETVLETDVNIIQIPLNLKPGTYFVDLFSGGNILSFKKLIVRPK